MNRPRASPLDLQLFQAMAQTKPFHNQLAFLARNLQVTHPNVNNDRSRPHVNLYSTMAPRPTKRKLNELILVEDENALFARNDIKRPRALDMNKIRTVTFDHRAFRLPRLIHHGYYTEPSIEELKKYFNKQGQCIVQRFTITRKNCGSVTFRGLNMNLAGLDLDQLVRIERQNVTICPKEGEEFNFRATISLFDVYPIDPSKPEACEEITDPNRLIAMNYGRYLEAMTKQFRGDFLHYDVDTGTWTFQVEHPSPSIDR